VAKESLNTTSNMLTTVEVGYDVMKGLNTLCRYNRGA